MDEDKEYANIMYTNRPKQPTDENEWGDFGDNDSMGG